MPATTTLPVLAGLAIVGAAAGINLGRSAISEINPAYFTEEEDSFHADLAPYRSPDWGQVHAAEYRAAQQPVLIQGLGSGCVGCRDYPVEYVPRHDPALDANLEGWSAPPQAQVVVAQVAPPDPDRERIQRYASYPVSGDQAAAPAPAAEAAPHAEQPLAPAEPAIQ